MRERNEHWATFLAALAEQLRASLRSVANFVPIAFVFAFLGLAMQLLISGSMKPTTLMPLMLVGIPASLFLGVGLSHLLKGGKGAEVLPPGGPLAARPDAPSPQEARFLRIARERGLLSGPDCGLLVDWRAEKRAQGQVASLWDGAVLRGLLDADSAEELRGEAGDLDRESVGSYSVLRKLGEGGMGVVWLAADREGRRVALKLLSREHAAERTYLTRFFREAQAAIALRHPNLVQGIEVGQDGSLYFYAMEYVPGGSVAGRLVEAGRFTPEHSVRIVRDVCRGLSYAHGQGVVHRDVKPANIMLAEGGAAKLADLGLARRTDRDITALTTSGQTLGTPHYMAPEQIRDARQADARSDIYSLGATWYHMLVGAPPFRGPTALDICHQHLNAPVSFPDPVASQVPGPMQALIVRMMAKDPAGRFASAAEAGQALAAFA
jgi:hypothetical protein